MMEPHNSSSGGGTSDPKVKRAASPLSSCVSMNSESSPVPGCVLMKSESPPVPSCVLMESESSPLPSCVSMKSESSPVPSYVSMKSDWSMGEPPDLSSGPVTSDLHAQKKPVKISKDKLESVFKELEHKIISLVKNELKRFKNLLSPDYPACTERQVEDEEDQSSVREGAMKITLHVLRNMNQTDLANTLQTKLVPACYRKLKSKLREKCQKINEGISQHGTTALLNEIYTELYITEGGSGEVNNEHEVRQIETASRRPATQETPIKCSDIFRPLPGQDKVIRTVLTKGVAGIGKTVSVQKFILDWSEGNVNQDVLFIFPLPFRELNLMKEKKLSLVQLLHCFFPETSDLKPTHYTYYKILFIFDGLDECRLPLDFQNNDSVWDVTESTSVDVLLTNLIKGNLLPSALLWITSRPAAANQIPPECVDQVTEVRGFSGPQKEEYFRKRISDQSLANRIISHMKSSRSLYIMCHIPVFCWIAATVLERMLGEAESGEIPKTLTQMFTHFLIFHIKHKDQKYDQKSDTDPQQTRKHVLALGKLAFQQLEKGDLIFYEDDLRNSGINVREMSVYSGMCTQIFREEFGLHLGKVFSFVHLSVQEFLAALYVFITFISTNTNVLEQQQPKHTERQNTLCDFLNSAVDKALQSQNGHLDLFLRFLLGLSLESNQTLLRGLLTQTGSSSHSKEETVQYIKEKIRENPSPEKSINLFHCLNELNDHSLVQEVQTYLSRGGDTRLRGVRLSPAQWSAVVFVMLNSEEELGKFDLSKYDPSEECLVRLLPVVKASRKVILSGCGLTEESCKSLTSVLQTENSLKELEINNNDLQDSGVEQLCAGLKSSNCKLEILRLSGCGLTEESCKSLTSLLQTETSLKQLEINNNDLQDSGVEQLCAGLKSSNCKLEILRLSLCGLTEESCKSLISVLETETSLKQLEINNNDLQDSGVEQLCAGLKSSNCKLEILRLSGCLVTEEGCSSLASALSSNPSHLKELDLTYNHPGDSGVKLLSARLEDPHCRLDTLRVDHAGKISLKPGLRKYACELTLDPNTAHTRLSLSEGNRKVTCVEEQQTYPDHPERFDYWEQVMCRESLTGRCYWEAECSGVADIAVTYKGINRKGDSNDCWFGRNIKSWKLHCYNNSYSVYHNNNHTDISGPSSSNRVGVYLDWPAGTLSFYSVSSHTHTLTHLHTFHSTFTEPLYAGFGFWCSDSSVCVCELE
ncbi:NACHT, LRR and PYD domains-containing protein 3-like isoform X2 [Brachyhypopomus gauderio]|uniref:NACHT, LRR and PYD domains-containing protein 3-like isoform X2 n=1 Tax=Brachyhypopomus gauderio TaxID=698409 RepID=UPI004041931C